MTLTYRTSGVWGAGKGSNLTPAEVDGSFYDLDDRVAAVEAAPPTPDNINGITTAGSQLTIITEASQVFGPLTIPIAQFNYLGDWEPTTVYTPLDIIRVGSAAYLVLVGHTSEASFDEAEGGSNPYYGLLVQDGRATGPVVEIPDQDGGTIYNPTLSEANGYFRFHDDTFAEFAIPVATSWPIGTMFSIAQWGAATIEIYLSGGGSGHFMSNRSDGTYTTNGIGTVVHVKKVQATVWDMWGEQGTIP